MTTRKILISNQYKALSKKVDNLIDKINILPNIDDYPFIDIIFVNPNGVCLSILVTLA